MGEGEAVDGELNEALRRAASAAPVHVYMSMCPWGHCSVLLGFWTKQGFRSAVYVSMSMSMSMSHVHVHVHVAESRSTCPCTAALRLYPVRSYRRSKYPG